MHKNVTATLRIHQRLKLKPRPEDTPKKTFRDYELGFVHIDIKYLPQMPDGHKRRYLFVAIDRATRWVTVALKPSKSARSALAFFSCWPCYRYCLSRIRA